MASTITIVLRDATTGAGLSGQTVTLRLTPFSTTTYTLADVAGKAGAYQVADVDSGLYKLWVNGSEDTSFGGTNGRYIFEADDILFKTGGTMSGNIAMGSNRITGLPSASGNDEPLTKGQGATTYMPLSGGTFTGNVAMGNNTLSGLPDATTDTEPITKGQAEDDYGQLAANNVWSGTNTFADQVAHSTYPPLCDVDPTNDNHLTRREWVIEQINDGAVPYQESINVIRLMPGGTQQTNKVYTTFSAASNAARLLAGDLQRMTVEIRGAGDGGATIIPSDGGISGNEVFNSYVSYKGINQNVLLELSGTNTFGAVVGTIISDLTFYCDDPDADITFTGFVFNNVYFDFQDSTALNFNSCTFRGCDIKIVEGSATYTSCKGGNVVTNTDLPDEISGWGGKDPNDF